MPDPCPHLIAPNQCSIVQQLTGLPVLTMLTEAACAHCTTKVQPPQTLNQVTVSLACSELHRAGAEPRHRQVMAQHGHLLRQVLPRWSEQAWSVAAAVAAWVAQGAPIVTAAVYEHRLSRCDVCPNRDNHRCRHCGCFIRGKATIATERCPIGLW